MEQVIGKDCTFCFNKASLNLTLSDFVVLLFELVAKSIMDISSTIILNHGGHIKL